MEEILENDMNEKILPIDGKYKRTFLKTYLSISTDVIIFSMQEYVKPFWISVSWKKSDRQKITCRHRWTRAITHLRQPFGTAQTVIIKFW